MSDNTRFVLFSVFDENRSWYLEENIKRFCTDAAHVDTQDPQFYASNVMHSECLARGSLQTVPHVLPAAPAGIGSSLPQGTCSAATGESGPDEMFHPCSLPAINGFVFDNLQPKLCLHEVVYWYVLSVGAQTDFLSIFFSGNTFKRNMVFEDVLTLFPFSGETVFMSLEKPG